MLAADHYHPIIQEMKLAADGASYTVLENCTVEFELSHANKGFEGIQYHEKDGGAATDCSELDAMEAPPSLTMKNRTLASM